MPARDQRLLLAAAVCMCALLLLGALAGHPDVLAFAGPLFLLAVPLLAGRYVGEEALDRLPRGGRLIAEALAVRPPPRSVAS